MSDDEYSTEMELYGVSPRIIAMMMFFTTLLAPLGYIPEFIGNMFYFHIYPKVYSTTWQVLFSTFYRERILITWVFFQDFLLMIALLTPPWIYAYWIVRYYQGKSSKYWAATIGLVSILIPLFASLYWTVLSGQLDIIYPIPLQFVIGLIILWRIEGPEIISPWSGVRLDFSWWRWKRSKRGKQVVIVEEEKQHVEKEDWL